MVYFEGKNALNLILAGAPPGPRWEEREKMPPEPLLRHPRHKMLKPPLGRRHRRLPRAANTLALPLPSMEKAKQ